MTRKDLDWWPKCVRCGKSIDPRWFCEDLGFSHTGVFQRESDCPHCRKSIVLTIRVSIEIT